MGGANEKFFNCWYDKESCRDFFNLVPREKMFSVNVPMKSANDSIFSFTRDFINSFQENPNLKLWQDIFLADPSGWEPEDMLMWDDLTSFFLLNSQSFKSSGGYWQPSSKPNTYLEEWKKLISYCATEENYDSI